MTVAIKPNSKFGLLTVLSLWGNKNNKPHYKCKCDCGENTVVSNTNLLFGTTRSCGHLRGKKEDIEWYTGKKIGHITVIEQIAGPIYLVKCDCDKEVKINKYGLLRRQDKSCGACISQIRSAEKILFRYYKYGARNRNIPFNLPIKHFRRLIVKNCTYCGSTPFQSVKNRIDKSPLFFYTGIDRMDSSIGYSSKNSVPCCGICNRAKGQRTVEEFRAWIDRIVQWKIKR